MTDLIACTRCSHLTIDIDHPCRALPLGDITALPCPACGHDAIYSHGLNRYLHCDSRRSNADCWLQCVRGNTDPDIHRANDAYLARRSRWRHRGSAA